MSPARTSPPRGLTFAPGGNVRRYLYRSVVLMDNDFDWSDGVGAFGNRPARGDRHRLPGSEHGARGPPGGDACDNREWPRRVCSADRVSVHGRTGKRRHIGPGPGRLGQDPAGGGGQRQALARKRLRVLEHALDRFVDADQRCHAGNATACSRYSDPARRGRRR